MEIHFVHVLPPWVSAHVSLCMLEFSFFHGGARMELLTGRGNGNLWLAGRAVLVSRGEQVMAGEGPVIVATHSCHLEEVLQHTPKSRWSDLVFLQNGMLQPFLARHNLLSNTQALLYMSAADDPSLPHGQVRIVGGGRATLVWGRWAPAVVSVMQREGLLASVVASHDIFMENTVEKLLWSSVFWLLSSALGGVSVGIIAENYKADVHELVSELLPLATNTLAKLKDEGGPFHTHPTHELKSDEQVSGCPHGSSVDTVVERLCLYSKAIENTIPSVQMAMSEFESRNGWFLRQEVTSCHLSWLQRARERSTDSFFKQKLQDIQMTKGSEAE